MILHSVVIPVFNEFHGLQHLFDRLRGLVDTLSQRGFGHFEIILVNDGSTDGSTTRLNELHAKDARFKILHLSRNFGHQMAISAGMEWASGTTITVMDADLQDPPELIEQFLLKWREGNEVVYAVRRSRAGESIFKLWTARLFYRAIQRLTSIHIPVDAGDFRLLDRRVVDALKQMPERHRFVRGLVSWVGFRQVGVPYDRAQRAYGQTHYPLTKMLRLAVDGVTAFSTVPLQIASWVGAASSVLAFLGVVYTLYIRLFTDKTIHGWTSLMVVVLLIGGVQLLALGAIGEYLGRTYDESRRRPLYLLQATVGFEDRSK